LILGQPRQNLTPAIALDNNKVLHHADLHLAEHLSRFRLRNG
jgi:hypothetical protein